MASDCKANIIVVDSDQQMSKILTVRKWDTSVCMHVHVCVHAYSYICFIPYENYIV